MSCYRTILVAYDGSADADTALDHAVSLARDQHARLLVLTVAHRPAINAADANTAIATREIEDGFIRLLHEAVGRIPKDIGVDSLLVHGKPARKILDVAREHRCDLIVMGSHGHGRLHGALIGTTSSYVLRDSEIPVLLIRRACQKTATAAAGSEALQDPHPVRS